MRYRRMPIEAESPEQFGYDRIDCNLSESSISDRILGDVPLAGLESLVLCYGHHVGEPRLREEIARGTGLAADDVLVTAGAAAALFIVATSLLEPGDHLVVARPNYATNLETPRAIGAELTTLDLRFEEGFRVDVDRLEALLRPRTRLVSLTTPHNPTGRAIPRADLVRIVRLVEARGAHLLLDETYRELSLAEPGPLLAATSPRVISVSSLSKAYGLPGIRVGWLACRDRVLQETFLAAKEQISICGSVLDEAVARLALERRAEWLPRVRARMQEGLAALRAFFARERRMEWVEPEGGVVCFPRIRADARVDVERFYEVLQDDLRTWVGPGHWFEQDRRHMRIGFGWPTPAELTRGLANLTRAMDGATQPR